MNIETDADHIEQQFIERFNHLRRCDKYSDCSFKVEGHVIHCHKLILTASSPVFEAMFYGPLAETRAVKIDDISLVTFENMLDYIYSGKLNKALSVQELLNLYYCAQKYIIEGLASRSLNNLNENTHKNNVLNILKLSYDMHLEDITYSCIYTLKHWMEADYHFGNHLIQQTALPIPAQLLSFLIHETFEFQDYNAILCFVRAWCLMECSLRSLKPNSESFSTVLRDCVIPKAVNDVLVFQNYAFGKGSNRVLLLQRTYYKAARLLNVKVEPQVKAIFWVDKFTAVKSFSINSRLFSSSQKFDYNMTYTEEVFVEILAGADRPPIYSKKQEIRNVEYNENCVIPLPVPIILFPGQQYILKLKWEAVLGDWEYSRSIFSNFARQKGLQVNFKEEGDIFMQGSLLNGIVCETENL